MGGGSGTTTWTLDRFSWGRRVNPGQLVWVERRVVDPEPGYHIHGAVVWLLEDGADFSKRSRLCTSLNWLEPA